MDHADGFQFINRNETPCPLGTVTTWDDGDVFDCLLTFESSSKTLQAEQAGATSLFSGIVYKETPVAFHSVIRRLSDGSIYRVTDHPADNETPSISTFQVKSFRAERYVLPTE